MTQKGGCSHGVSFDTRCIKCEIVSTKGLLEIAYADVERHRQRYAELLSEDAEIEMQKTDAALRDPARKET